MSILNPFAAAKRLTAVLAALAGIGIDAEDEKTDIAAALQAKIDEAKASADVSGAVQTAVQAALEKEREAHLATTTVLREKAEMFDALEKQAQDAGIDLRATAKGGTLAKDLDGKARDHAKKILGSNAPDPNTEIDPAPSAPPTGSKAAHYQQLLAKNDPKAEEYLAANMSEILAGASFSFENLTPAK